MGCSVCQGTYVAWDNRMLDQLTDGMRASFPAVLTHKYACDEAVVSLLGLVKWYKNTTRRDEVKMLMQGILPPSADLTSQQPLLPARTLPPGPLPAPMESHEFEEPEDTTGQARVRGTQSNPPLLPTTVVPTPANQTADWCHREKAAAASGSGSSSSSSTVAPTRPLLPTSTTTKQRKVYSCRICGKPMASPGHTQFRGQRYCPEQPGQMSKEEWLMLRRIEAKTKAATTPSP